MSRRIDWKAGVALFFLAFTLAVVFADGRLIRLQAADVPVIAQAAPDRAVNQKTEADRLLEQGITEFDGGRYETAAKLYQQALTLYQSSHNQTGVGGVLAELGLTYATLGDYDRAIDSYQQSLAIARAIPDHQLEATALNSLGFVYEDRGNFQQALTLYEQSLAIAPTGSRGFTSDWINL